MVLMSSSPVSIVPGTPYGVMTATSVDRARSARVPRGRWRERTTSARRSLLPEHDDVLPRQRPHGLHPLEAVHGGLLARLRLAHLVQRSDRHCRVLGLELD